MTPRKMDETSPPQLHGGLIRFEAGQWREILALATAMGGRGITPHSMTCNAVLKVDGYHRGGWLVGATPC